MAGAILYGLTHGIRSSRRLEWACGNAVDLLWLVEGRTIDHSTFCDFRTKFQREHKDLFGDSVSGHTLPAELATSRSDRRDSTRLSKPLNKATPGSPRREVALRTKTESGKKRVARRAHLAEPPNGFIKEVLGLGQFLLRGLDKVRTEWLWACTAFNLRKLMIAMEKLRADGSLEPV